MCPGVRVKAGGGLRQVGKAQTFGQRQHLNTGAILPLTRHSKEAIVVYTLVASVLDGSLNTIHLLDDYDDNVRRRGG